MGVSGGGQSSKSSGGTGQISSLSFVPALLSNAFFGTGIGLQEGGFTSTGLGNFGGRGQLKGKQASSLVDPFGLAQVIGSNPLLNQANPFSSFGGSGGFGGGGGGGGFGGSFGGFGGDAFAGGGGGGGGSFFNQPFDAAPGLPSVPNATGFLGDNIVGRGLNPLTSFDPAGIFGGNASPANILDPAGLFGGLFGSSRSPEDHALNQVKKLLKFSPQALGLGTGGILSPFDLVSNLTDLADPNINPAVGSALQGLGLGNLSGQAAEGLLGGIGSTFGEGLETGFKPDLQPIIDEASRGFFQDIVPQLGQSNVALQEGVGPFSTDLSGQLVGAGTNLASQLGSLEVENQNRAADRRGELLGISGLITDQLFNAPIDAARNRLNLGEQLALQGTRGGRQSTLLQLLAGQIPSGPIQASNQSSSAKGGSGGIQT